MQIALIRKIQKKNRVIIPMQRHSALNPNLILSLLLLLLLLVLSLLLLYLGRCLQLYS